MSAHLTPAAALAALAETDTAFRELFTHGTQPIQITEK